MITVVNKDNSKWRLIYDENILLLDMTNRLSFDVKDLELKFDIRINFIFLDSNEKLKANINISEDGRALDITLHQWNTDNSFTHVENIEPLKLNTNDKNKVWIKYRTQTNDKNNWRNFHITIWTEA